MLIDEQPLASMAIGERQWLRIIEALPGSLRARVRNHDVAYRNFIEGVLWIAATDSAWHELPDRYGSWRATYVRFVRWNIAGVWGTVTEALGSNTRPAQGLAIRAGLSARARRSRASRRAGTHWPHIP